MKYLTPKYEMAVMETEDVLTASTKQTPKYEVEQTGNGSGLVEIAISKLFG